MRTWPSPHTIPHNLPAPLTSLIGREHELDEIGELLGRERLVTLVGPAGIGKTRLALHIAARALCTHPNGAWFVDLSLVSNPSLVIQSVAAALSVREQPGEALAQTVVTFCADKVLLLVLDNCEHLLHACTDLVRQLLPACGNVRVLATSREEFGLIGEAGRAVSPLRVPRDESAEQVAESEAARLLMARAGGIDVDEASTGAVARICQRLGGVPLAIELAAGRVGELSLLEVEEKLEHQFDLLATERTGGPERQRSLHAALEWGHGLLTEPQRVLLRRSAVFAGPFTGAAVAQVCSSDQAEDSEVILRDLVRKSLLVRLAGGGHVHFRMQEPVRHFALNKLHAAGEEDTVFAAHAHWCAAMVERSDSGYRNSEQIESSLKLVDWHADLRAAQAWSLTHDPELALVLAGGLTRFWVAHGHLEEGRDWLRQVLVEGRGSPSARAKALWGRGLIACLVGDFLAVGPDLEEGSALARQVKDGAVLARLQSLVGVTRLFTDPPAAIEALEEAITLARRHRETTTLASSLALIGFAHILCGELEQAVAPLEECLAGGAELSDGQPYVMSLVGLGHVRLHLGEPERARERLDNGVVMARRISNPIWLALAQAFLAELEVFVTNDAAARDLARDAVAVARRTAAAPVIGLCLAVAGDVELAVGDTASSVPLFEEALALCASGERGGVLARALVGLGRAHLTLGDSDAAQQLLEEAATLADRRRNLVAAGIALHWLGRCAAKRGEHDSALGLYREALAAQRRAGHCVALPSSIEAVAAETAHQGDVAKAAQLAAGAESLRAKSCVPRSCADQEVFATLTRLVNSDLAPTDREAAERVGRRLLPDRLVNLALGGCGLDKRPPHGWLSLTASERAVVELVAEGLTNVEIAQRLVVATGTVKTHLAHAFDKLNLRSRREVARAYNSRESGVD